MKENLHAKFMEDVFIVSDDIHTHIEYTIEPFSDN